MSQAITETVVLLLREGVELDSATSGSDADKSPGAQVFSELINTVKAQPGCLSQFWVIKPPSISRKVLMFSGSPS